MRHARTFAPLLGLLLVAALALPAGAGVRTASSQSILSAGVITAGDVPSSWSSSKQADTDLKAYRKIPACKQFVSAVDAVRKGGPRKLSPTFTDSASPNQLTMAQDTVFALKSSGAATKAINAIRSAAPGNCIEQVALKATGSGSTADVVDISSQLQGVGNDAVGYEITLHATGSNGAPVTAVFDLVGARVGRALVTFYFGNEGTRLAQAPAIVNAVVNRLASANA